MQGEKSDSIYNLSEMSQKFHFISLGCPRNLVDSEVMVGLLLKAGYVSTIHLDQADFLIINTCSFLEASRSEGFDAIQKVFDSKKKGSKVIVAGCMAKKCKDDLVVRFPEIHFLVGSGDAEKILDAVISEKPGESFSSSKSYLEWGDVPRTLSTPKHWGYLKIAEGC